MRDLRASGGGVCILILKTLSLLVACIFKRRLKLGWRGWGGVGGTVAPSILSLSVMRRVYFCNLRETLSWRTARGGPHFIGTLDSIRGSASCWCRRSNGVAGGVVGEVLVTGRGVAPLDWTGIRLLSGFSSSAPPCASICAHACTRRESVGSD